VRAHQQWLPNLGREMANRPESNDPADNCVISTIGGWVTTLKEPKLGIAGEVAATPRSSRPAQADEQTEARNAPDAGPAKAAAVLPETAAERPEAANVRPDDGARAATANERAPSRAADQTDDLLNPTEEELRATGRPGGSAVRGFTAQAGPGGGRIELSVDERPRAGPAGTQVAQADARRAAGRDPSQTDDLLNPSEEDTRGGATPNREAERPARPEARPEARPAQPEVAAPKAPAATVSDERPRNRAADQTDDLLNPDAPGAGVERAARPEQPVGRGDAASARPDSGTSRRPSARPEASASAETPATKATPVISIESDVDPESWADYGGWYRQDYTIFYRPTGHKDKFIYSWLFLTGPQAPKSAKSPAAAVFNFLTSKDAQGSCTKCHSVDEIQGQGRSVNFSPISVTSKQGRFTSFVHEPHFGILENRGCLTCHNLEKGSPYLQSYEQGDPRNFASNFGAVKKDLCQTCHTSSVARQDCLLCHKYHVHGVATPVMQTKIPTE
jgi:hypothetical protein